MSGHGIAINAQFYLSEEDAQQLIIMAAGPGPAAVGKMVGDLVKEGLAARRATGKAPKSADDSGPDRRRSTGLKLFDP